MNDRTIHAISARNGDVVITLRAWDGVGKPEYEAIMLSPDRAEAWSFDLNNLAAEARQQTSIRAKEQLRKAREDLAAKKAEVLWLEKEIERCAAGGVT